MNNELAVANQDIEVIAETPDEMKTANTALIEWCVQKINAMRVDFIELDAAYKSAVEKKWKHTTLKRHAEMAKKRMEFYRKIKTALEHGYYIVPTFPVEVFAVRTDRKKPLKLITTSTWRDHSRHEQKPAPLIGGEGEYRNPFPEVYQRDITTDPAKPTKQYFAENWEAIDFPLNMAKPRIMEASSRAMALKLFDDLGVLPGVKRNVDPIIVARIKDPRSSVYSQRFVSFIVAWALNTRTL